MIDVDHCTDLDRLRHEVKALRHQLGQRDKKLVAQRTDIGNLHRKLEAVTEESIGRRREIEAMRREMERATA